MNEILEFLIHSILWVLLIWVAFWLVAVWNRQTTDWRPRELKQGELMMIEQDLRTRYPYPVIGRPDQVYRLTNGLHVPVESKNRNHFTIHETDVAQLSLQAWLLRRNGLPTTSRGYLVINNRRTGKRRVLAVSLLNDAACERLIRRYLDVISKRIIPVKNYGRQCQSCGHSGIC